MKDVIVASCEVLCVLVRAVDGEAHGVLALRAVTRGCPCAVLELEVELVRLRV